MLLCINTACHTDVQPNHSFWVGGKVRTSPAAGIPIIVNGKKNKSSITIAKIQDREIIFQLVVTGIIGVDLRKE